MLFVLGLSSGALFVSGPHLTCGALCGARAPARGRLGLGGLTATAAYRHAAPVPGPLVSVKYMMQL